MPNVLIVGDAVSAGGSGYLHQLQRLLSPGLATVQHVTEAPAVGGLMTSAAALQCLSGWLAAAEFDIIVLSIGLGDCGAGSGGGGGLEFAPNLKKLVALAGARSTPVIYATATPFGSSLVSVNRSCVAANNAAARAIMAATPPASAGGGKERCPNRRLADVGSYAEQYCGGASYSECRIQNRGSVLFNVSDSEPSGLQFTALPVAEAIQHCLPVKKIACTVGARNGTAVPCTWPPPPPPPPPPPAPPSPYVPCKTVATLGCYSESKDHLIFNTYACKTLPKLCSNVTLEKCASACHSLHFELAGTDSNHCFCGGAAELNPHNSRPMAECQVTTCSGDPKEKCGGNGRLLVYNFSCSSSVASAAAPLLAVARPKKQCGGGFDTYKQNSTIPNVLLIGDSVMFAHIGPVVKQIFDRCELAPDFCLNATEILPRGRYPNDGMLASVQMTGQAANTASGVACIKDYIQGKKWDVILIVRMLLLMVLVLLLLLTLRCCCSQNFGIHDTWVHQRVPPAQYGENLQKIFTEGLGGLAPGGKLIWSSTTPISSNCTGCGDGTTMQHVDEYNSIALDVFRRVTANTTSGVVNDLHEEVNSVCGVNFTSCALQCYNNEHPSIPGAAFLGVRTALTILPFLNPKRK